jgi:hypothetical protein
MALRMLLHGLRKVSQGRHLRAVSERRLRQRWYPDESKGCLMHPNQKFDLLVAGL